MRSKVKYTKGPACNNGVLKKYAKEVEHEKEYSADFLWPFEDDSIEEAGFEFANAKTEEYQEQWWNILIERIKEGKDNE